MCGEHGYCGTGAEYGRLGSIVVNAFEVRQRTIIVILNSIQDPLPNTIHKIS